MTMKQLILGFCAVLMIDLGPVRVVSAHANKKAKSAKPHVRALACHKAPSATFRRTITL